MQTDWTIKRSDSGGVRIYGITVITILKSGVLGFRSKSARFSVFQTFCGNGKMQFY